MAEAHSHSNITSPAISDKELSKELERGNVLAYERASDAQLAKRKQHIRQQIESPNLDKDDFLRYVFMNTLYATISFSATLWFGARNVLEKFPRFGTWLSEKGILRDSKSLLPYIADHDVYNKEIINLATEWAQISGPKEVALHDEAGKPVMKAGQKVMATLSEGEQRYDVLKKLSKLLKTYGFKGGVEQIENVLEEFKGKAHELTSGRVTKILFNAIEAAEELRDAADGRPHFRAMAAKIIGLFEFGELSATTKDGAVKAKDTIIGQIQKELAYADGRGPKEISERIFNRRVTPVIGAAALLGAASVGYFSYRGALERKSLLKATDLASIENVENKRNKSNETQPHANCGGCPSCNGPARSIAANSVVRETALQAQPASVSVNL